MTQPSHYVGLDLSLEKTAVAISDQSGEIVFSSKVDTEPEAITRLLAERELTYARIGFEAGPMAQSVFKGLTSEGLPAVCVEARHAHGFMKSQINKNDRNDARNLAVMMRCGVFKPVHIKSEISQRHRALLFSRRTLKQKTTDVSLYIRGELRSLGLKIGKVSGPHFERRVRELVADDFRLRQAFEPLLCARAAMLKQLDTLHKAVLDEVRDDPVCLRLMTAPGVGPVVALTYKSSIDVPESFVQSKDVAAIIGLTPRQYQSGEMNIMGGVSKQGDQYLRSSLVEAGYKVLNNVKRPSALRSWGLAIAERKGEQKAAVAIARRLAVILHRMWVDETDFEASPQALHT